MKIHWKLIKEYIEKADPAPDGCKKLTSRCDKCEKKECSGCENSCLVYCSCGPYNRCSRPCKYCLYWTGYGLDYEDSLEENGMIL